MLPDALPAIVALLSDLRERTQSKNGVTQPAPGFLACLGMTALTSADETLVVVPISSGLGLRLGYNVGYLKFTTAPTWNPF
jgi:hypothetical protein